MNMTHRRIDKEAVEKLLQEPLIQVEDEPCKTAETLALVLCGEATPRQIAQAETHLASCEYCRKAVLVLESMSAQGVVEPLTIDPRVAKQKGLHIRASGTKVRWRAAAAVAAVFLAVLATVLFLDRGARTINEDSLVIKGHNDELFIAVERQGSRFLLRPGGQLKTGDNVGLFYSTKSPGYLAVYSLDQTGVLGLLYPAGQVSSAPISPAVKAPLPDGGIVQDGSGCEWFIALFSDKPISLQQAADEIRSTQQPGENCTQKIDVLHTRSIRIIPFLR